MNHNYVGVISRRIDFAITKDNQSNIFVKASKFVTLTHK